MTHSLAKSDTGTLPVSGLASSAFIQCHVNPLGLSIAASCARYSGSFRREHVLRVRVVGSPDISSAVQGLGTFVLFDARSPIGMRPAANHWLGLKRTVTEKFGSVKADFWTVTGFRTQLSVSCHAAEYLQFACLLFVYYVFFP